MWIYSFMATQKVSEDCGMKLQFSSVKTRKKTACTTLHYEENNNYEKKLCDVKVDEVKEESGRNTQCLFSGTNVRLLCQKTSAINSMVDDKLSHWQCLY